MSTAEGRAYIRTAQFKDLKSHVYDIVRRTGVAGATTQEVTGRINFETSEEFITYSNPVSGALSRLHNVDQHLVRLKEKRGGFSIYVHPSYVNGRDYYEPRAPRRPDGGWVVTDEMALRAARALAEANLDHRVYRYEGWARAALEAALNPEEGED